MRKISTLLLFVLAACDPAPQSTEILLHAPDGNRYSFHVEIADDADERAQGLMGRSTLAQNKGMLFIFPEEDIRTFWMKDTLIPLDILFFDASGMLVSHAKMMPCSQDPCPSFTSSAPALTALEVNAEVADMLHVGAGWKLER